ncbi:MAG TPA: MFS transporter, partial [Nocardioidaceae bacterium]
AGRFYMRIGFRDTALIGAALMITGSLLMLTIGEGTSLWAVAGYTFVIGLGLGYTASPTLVAVQSSVGWENRGVVTAANMFARSVGSAVGVAVFGAIANATLAGRFAEASPGAEGRLPSTADDAALALDAGSGVAPAVRDFVREALAAATHNVFIGLAVLAVLVLVGVAVMPRQHRE